ncbi:MAG TPA: SpoIID/LytB domain-containing protein [Gemmatimonadaceae bacterium]|nr:SpoIID/LytB domain-containing protein [Gemmatimonadaceae bacterium]
MLRLTSFFALLGIAACGSFMSRGDPGDIEPAGDRLDGQGPADNPVRIALGTNDTAARIGATGEWRLYDSDGQRLVARGNPVNVWRIIPEGRSLRVFRGTGADGEVRPGALVARPVSNTSFMTWNGKKYRGELVVSATDTGLFVLNRLSMESYLRGVVPREIGNRTAAEFAAVQAQAVAARTYAYNHLSTERAFDMYATVQDQVYGGMDDEKPQADSAVVTTRDMVVLYSGRPINTPYHSTCGGTTSAVSEVWYAQPDQPYLKPVSDRIPGSDRFYCDPSPRFRWTNTFTGPQLRAVMDKYLANYTSAPRGGPGKITNIRERGRTPSNRVEALLIDTERGTYTLRGNDTRFVLRDPKGAIMNSTSFNFTTTRTRGEVTSLTVTGGGYGHGIGMCQWGAIGRARAGQGYSEILQTYYPGTTVGRIQ